MKKRIVRISVGVFAGIMILSGTVWVLGRTLGNNAYTRRYAGKAIFEWRQQLFGGDATASNAAIPVVNAQVIPQLVDVMFHDTHDSATRVWLIDTLNMLPGMQIYYVQADERRATAAGSLGELGPAARPAVPDLVKAVKGTSAAVRVAAITALGRIHSEPDTVIPVLIPYLDDENLDVPAAKALAEFGSLAKPAVPKLLPLLKARDDDDQAAGREALLKIDPDAAAKAGVKPKAGKGAKLE